MGIDLIRAPRGYPAPSDLFRAKRSPARRRATRAEGRHEETLRSVLGYGRWRDIPPCRGGYGAEVSKGQCRPRHQPQGRMTHGGKPVCDDARGAQVVKQVDFGAVCCRDPFSADGGGVSVSLRGSLESQAMAIESFGAQARYGIIVRTLESSRMASRMPARTATGSSGGSMSLNAERRGRSLWRGSWPAVIAHRYCSSPSGGWRAGVS
jgi:hypothetical protein